MKAYNPDQNTKPHVKEITFWSKLEDITPTAVEFNFGIFNHENFSLLKICSKDFN